GEEGDDHDLDVRDVGERLDLQVTERQDAEDRERERTDEGGHAPPDRKVDQLVEHGGGCPRLPQGPRQTPRRFSVLRWGRNAPSGLIAPSFFPVAADAVALELPVQRLPIETEH